MCVVILSMDKLATIILLIKVFDFIEAAMGTSLQRRKESEMKYREAIHEMGDVLLYRYIFILFKLLFL